MLFRSPLVDKCPGLQATLNTPYALALDSAGNLYIADQGNQAIRVASPLPSGGYYVYTLATSIPLFAARA